MVFRQVLEGYLLTDIESAIRTLHPTADARKVIRSALASLFEVANQPQDMVVGWCMEAAKDIMRKSLETGDLSNALACVREIAKLKKA
jgi:hypothetical protein